MGTLGGARFHPSTVYICIYTYLYIYMYKLYSYCNFLRLQVPEQKWQWVAGSSFYQVWRWVFCGGLESRISGSGLIIWHLISPASSLGFDSLELRALDFTVGNIEDAGFQDLRAQG